MAKHMDKPLLYSEALNITNRNNPTAMAYDYQQVLMKYNKKEIAATLEALMNNPQNEDRYLNILCLAL